MHRFITANENITKSHHPGLSEGRAILYTSAKICEPSYAIQSFLLSSNKMLAAQQVSLTLQTKFIGG